jgi:hypothetical protein
LCLNAQGQWLPGSIENCPSLWQNNPFLEVLFFTQPSQFFALKNLELKSAHGHGQKHK